MKRKRALNNSIIYILICFICIVMFPFSSGWIIVWNINIIIVSCYLIFFPKNLFHPNHIIFAFSFLYVVLPSSIQWVYDYFNLDYLLPWGKASHWDEYQIITYIDIILSYLVFYFSFYYFNFKRNDPVYYYYKPARAPLVLLVISSFLLLFSFLALTGGVSAWVNDYKSTFLLGREGLGIYNLLILNVVNLTIFLLGLEFYKTKGSLKKSIFLIALSIILFASFIQGLKSRFIILMIIFLFSYLYRVKLNLVKIFILGAIFFILLFIGNYIRSNGFYGTIRVFFEYMMTYFNTFELHNLIVEDMPSNLLQTVNHVFVKPANSFGYMLNHDYDLSIMLTKLYFPKDWELMSATQQWPLVTDLRLNYYGFILGWFVIIVYAWIISRVYGHVLRGNVAFMLIFILEFIRLFTVQRGTIFPWQLPIYLFSYTAIYLYMRFYVKSLLLEKK